MSAYFSLAMYAVTSCPNLANSRMPQNLHISIYPSCTCILFSWLHTSPPRQSLGISETVISVNHRQTVTTGLFCGSWLALAPRFSRSIQQMQNGEIAVPSKKLPKYGAPNVPAPVGTSNRWNGTLNYAQWAPLQAVWLGFLWLYCGVYLAQMVFYATVRDLVLFDTVRQGIVPGWLVWVGNTYHRGIKGVAIWCRSNVMMLIHRTFKIHRWFAFVRHSQAMRTYSVQLQCSCSDLQLHCDILYNCTCIPAVQYKL